MAALIYNQNRGKNDKPREVSEFMPFADGPLSPRPPASHPARRQPSGKKPARKRGPATAATVALHSFLGNYVKGPEK